ncbi:MAG: histidine kinase [Bacteroidia bacterium]|nr:histidine kinase [Bacteroidia bacterium]
MKASTINYLGIDDTRILGFGIPMAGFVITLSLHEVNPFEFPLDFLENYLFSCLYTTFFWLTNRQIIIFFRRKFPLPEQVNLRIVAQMVSVIAYTYLASILLCLIPKLVFKVEPVALNGASELRMTVVSLVASNSIAAIYEIVYVVTRWNQARFEAENLKKINLETQLESLKSQVNPHFLFNSLNTLVAIIPDQPEVAVEFVQNLSKVYRYVLEIRERPLITVKEELDFIRSYIFMLQIRYPQNLSFDIQISPQNLNKKVLPLSFQLLIENAIKHNIISHKQPLSIRISDQGEDWISIANNLQTRPNPDTGTGIGLSNISERYRMLGGKEIELIKTNEKFEVKLPFIEIEIS